MDELERSTGSTDECDYETAVACPHCGDMVEPEDIDASTGCCVMCTRRYMYA